MAFGITFLAQPRSEPARALGKDLAMHVVSAKPVPICVRRDEVPPEMVAKEKEILEERLKSDPKNAKKPPQILAKIIEGQLGKFYAERCLAEQPFVKGSLILYAVIWGFGILWYFYWKARNKRAGVDVGMTYGELPPD